MCCTRHIFPWWKPSDRTKQKRAIEKNRLTLTHVPFGFDGPWACCILHHITSHFTWTSHTKWPCRQPISKVKDHAATETITSNFTRWYHRQQNFIQNLEIKMIYSITFYRGYSSILHSPQYQVKITNNNVNDGATTRWPQLFIGAKTKRKIFIFINNVDVPGWIQNEK